MTKFLDKNNIDLICRAHQVVVDGFEFFCDRDFVTLFSAPDYCGEFDNKASVMLVDKNMKCSFKFLQPLKRLNVDSPQMKLLFQECERFEDLLPFKKTSISTMKDTLQNMKSDYVSIKTIMQKFKFNEHWESLR